MPSTNGTNYVKNMLFGFLLPGNVVKSKNNEIT